MIEIKVNIKINRPVSTVYQAFINPDNMTEWMKDLERFEIIEGEFGEVGALAHLHYKQKLQACH